MVVLHGDGGTRERLTAQLAGDGIEVVGAVPDVDRCVALTPDVVVVVHSGADTPAVHLCGQVRARLADGPGTEVVVVAREPRAVLLRLAVQAGATGFVDAASPPDVLCAAVRSVAADRPFFDPAVGRLVIDLVGRTPSEQRPYKLTRAQLDVVALLPLGLPNRLIAAELGISENTVKTHLRHALKKLGVRDRAQAAALVVREGLA
ncbi:MAG TPA: response regulator transcription factor [Frankiaceae bacterium]|nr:response regulator transcription factor [Frankiaceae bacterium]